MWVVATLGMVETLAEDVSAADCSKTDASESSTSLLSSPCMLLLLSVHFPFSKHRLHLSKTVLHKTIFNLLSCYSTTIIYKVFVTVSCLNAWSATHA